MNKKLENQKLHRNSLVSNQSWRETAINESDKGLKNVQKSSNSDSIDYSDIIKYKGWLKNNKRTVEMTPNLSNSKEVSS